MIIMCEVKNLRENLLKENTDDCVVVTISGLVAEVNCFFFLLDKIECFFFISWGRFPTVSSGGLSVINI